MNGDTLKRAIEKWKYTGKERPEFAEIPADDQESVWDYPRPPSITSESKQIKIFTKEKILIAKTSYSIKICETSSPPTYYIPLKDVEIQHLSTVKDMNSFCEWKGTAKYYSLNKTGEVCGWYYDDPYPSYAAIKGDEKVTAQEGDYYGIK
ncbi:hypothetical protein HK099_006732 [Clydaea vesicula]|uniref:DUF427 domain-containing protein n=1 Tax=Clydaea vesicula TaxID=447962 RepID=A0AAD5Y1Y7_9FUNG|nr:hypothetical protein HK099_006732 [Clydaea vesicula]